MQVKALKIYLAHGDDGQRRVIEANLQLLAHRIELSTAAPAVLLRRCEENPPDLAVIGSTFENEDCFDVFNQLGQQGLCPVIAIMQPRDLDRSQRLISDQVMGVLVEPVNESDLRTAIYLAKRRFDQSQKMRRRISELQDELQALDAEDGGEGYTET